ncbi:pyruvoyl-dependent arginine decarboxylase [Pullulanibacillus sp. KACC 23026]|uniref:pyruvoyl-dependent arginine decarboxylase n=1 Tax=Pullulanibacillus sp. KACC 23026 TaxID=3028315 RepID=UPI0023B0AAE9|nr:pyruvoyl-dependent arginine decarboxylase [Pullulanibacillus sp. KACC 23026]WEG12192.1 pyruvoyl-dependent arginine decarboxylase [Pullulanibacillus sp. KACC 23026]
MAPYEFQAINEALLVGQRIPKDYIFTKGYGDTDIGPGHDPWETGSFDMARQMAQIENFNIVRYTSIVPPDATEISIEQAKTLYHPGAVMECIISQMNGYEGDRLCAGVGLVQVKRSYDGKLISNYAAEYIGNADEEVAKKCLHRSLTHEFTRRYDPREYYMDQEKHCIQVHEVQHRYGTAIALIGFVTYIYPVLGKFQ